MYDVREWTGLSRNKMWSEPEDQFDASQYLFPNGVINYFYIILTNLTFSLLNMCVEATMWPFKCYVTQWRVGGCQLSRTFFFTKVYSSTLLALRRVGGGQISREKRYVRLEWPLLYVASIRTNIHSCSMF